MNLVEWIDDSIIVEFDNVSLSYPFGTKIKNISFQLRRGDNLVILAPEGSGKNMILDLIIRKTVPDKGEVYVEGQPISQITEKELPLYRRKIGYLSYNFGLINNLSVEENVLLPLRYHLNLSEEELHSKAEKLLKRYHLWHKKDLRPQKLTYNEALRLTFVRALVNDPNLIIMDNALGGQCPLGLAKFLQIAEQDLRHKHCSYIVASFEAKHFYSYADRFMLLYEGEMVFDGTPEELQSTDNPYVRQYLDHPLFGPMKPFFEPEQENLFSEAV